MIAVTSFHHILPPMIYSPKDRAERNVKGIRTEMLLQYISTLLAQAMGSLDIYLLYLICDNSNIHNKEVS